MTKKHLLKNLFCRSLIIFSLAGASLHGEVRAQVGLPPSGKLSAIIAGPSRHCLIIKEGKVYACGSNEKGEFGNGQTGVDVDEWSEAAQGLSHFIAVAVGFQYSLALKSDGTVWSWGLNEKGQLGNGTYNNSTIPVQVVGLTNVVAIGATSKGFASIALKANGTVWTWGSNAEGQLGIGDENFEKTTNVPVQVKGLNAVGTLANIIAITTGSKHVLALKADGTVWSWGENLNGSLGDGTMEARKAPIKIPNIENIVDVATGYDHSMALASNGTVWTWGGNSFGQLGNGSNHDGPATVSDMTPTLVKSSDGNGILSNIVSIAVGSSSYALAADGTVWCWGDDSYGQLGNGAGGGIKNLPIQMLNANMQVFDKITAICAGHFSVFALRSDGSIFACGFGPLGNPDLPAEPTVLLLSTQLPPSTLAAAGGGNHCLDLRTNGKIYAWGENNAGQLGNGANTNSANPVQVSTGYAQGLKIPISNTKAVAGGRSHSLSLQSHGKVYAWGSNVEGQLGNGTNNSNSFASAVQGLTNITAIAAAVGGDHNLALRSDGTVWSWGLNSKGQLGNGNNINQNTPVQVDDFIGIIAVAAGKSHSLALKSNGIVWAWGYNYAGQLGNGTSGIGTEKNKPVQVSGLSNVIAIAAGAQHSLALKADGSVWAWGDSMMGELGNGANIDSNVPVQVIVGYLYGQKVNLLSVKAIAAGASPALQSSFNLNPAGFGSNNIALTAGGYVFTWGENYKGQLGIGTIGGYKNVAIPAQNVSGIKSINNLGYHSIICKDDGSVLTVGGNSYGQLGNGTFSSGNSTYSSPGF